MRSLWEWVVGHRRSPKKRYARRVLRTILNLKRQLRTKTVLEMIFDVLESIRRVLGDFENFDFLGLHVEHLPPKK